MVMNGRRIYQTGLEERGALIVLRYCGAWASIRLRQPDQCEFDLGEAMGLPPLLSNDIKLRIICMYVIPANT